MTQISSTAVTVRSADAYTQTYMLPPAAAVDRSIVVNDEVSVQATRTGQTATATALNTGPAPNN